MGSAAAGGIEGGPAVGPVSTTSLRPVSVDVPVQWEGKTGSRVGVYFQRPDDARRTVALAPGNTLFLPPSQGQAERAKLTLTWTATNPLNTELAILVGGLVLCKADCSPEGNFTHGKNVTAVRGPSPLQLEVDTVIVGKDETLGLYVRQPSLTPENVRTVLETDQPFRVEGTVTFLVPPA